jgi:hypothetical protein
LELLLQEDLKSAKLMGRRSEVAAIGRVVEAVMERSQEFKSVLGLVQKRYEAMIETAAAETESAQLALEKQQEEKRQLLKRIDALSYENSLLKGTPGDRPFRAPTSPKATYDSTERLAAWGKSHHSHHQSVPEGKVVIPRLNLGFIGQPQSPAKRDPIYIEDL